MQLKSLFLLGFFFLSGCFTSFVEALPTLKGKTMDQIRSDLGRPNVIHQEEKTQLWTYKKEDCICLVFFDQSQTVQYAEIRGRCSEDLIKESPSDS